jgi:hypothetical protein
VVALLSGLSSGVGDWDSVDGVVKSSSNSVTKWNNNVTWMTALRVARMLFLLLVDFSSFFLSFF